MEGGITIRLAEQRDFTIIADLMNEALEPFCGVRGYGPGLSRNSI